MIRKGRRNLTFDFENTSGEISLPKFYDEFEKEPVKKIEKLIKGKKKTEKMWEIVLEVSEVRANWGMVDFVAVTKLSFNDYGEAYG